MITCFSLSLNSTRCPLPDKHCMASRNLFRQQKNKPNINAKNQSHTFIKRSGIDCIYGNCLRFPNALFYIFMHIQKICGVDLHIKNILTYSNSRVWRRYVFGDVQVKTSNKQPGRAPLFAEDRAGLFELKSRGAPVCVCFSRSETLPLRCSGSFSPPLANPTMTKSFQSCSFINNHKKSLLLLLIEPVLLLM